ncbi:Scr1 family TA system antitoxin-like transcriptional regulator [Streptomyces yerevanensis]|uniref:Scr1 family TA system antitoxin-like transcriptional regulator n=1 Tax=Streptomyces yerevanensis TaxID=66378 RepID=UPI00068C4D3F
MRSGLRKLQDSYVELYRSTKLLRVYSPVLIDEGYARALLSSNARFLGVPDDAAEAAAARLERSQIIHEPGHRFVMLIEAAVLYYQLGDAEAMAALTVSPATAATSAFPQPSRSRTVVMDRFCSR